MNLKIAFLAAASTLAMTGPASGAVLFFSGHYYEYVSAPGLLWTSARDAAAAASHDGQAGYLATVTSAGENEFLRASFSLPGAGFAGAWLGGGVTPSGAGPVGAWEVGPEAGQQFSLGGAAFGGAYANWGGIEPNNAPSKAYMNIGASFAGIANGQWADAAGGVSSGADPIQGYIVEYNGVPGVPEPATWAIMFLGLGMAGALLRRRRVIAA